MNLPSKLAHQLARSDYMVAISTLVSLLSFAFVIRDVINETPPTTGAVIGLVATLAIFVMVNSYSLKVRIDNRNLQEVARHFREINSIYREALFNCFWQRTTPLKKEDLIVEEIKTLTAICQVVSRIFTKMQNGKEFTVTVKLLTDGFNGISYATTYVRSIENCERDIGDRTRYEVNTGTNSGLDEALKNKPAGKLSYFHSADLTKEPNYANQRSGYLDWYKSAIVVPIRCPQKLDERQVRNYGFLTIDTMSRHQLNNGHHVVMMSALAEQMFNFMALMRSDYIIQKEHSQ